jgi:hypothetical protein
VAIYLRPAARPVTITCSRTASPSVSAYEAVFNGFDARTGCVRRAEKVVALARISLPVLRFDSLIRNSGTVLYIRPITRISTKRLNSRLTPRINENIIPLFTQRKYSSLSQVPVVAICTARGNCMYRRVVTICTASLTFNNSTFCPHTVFMCFVWI